MSPDSVEYLLNIMSRPRDTKHKILPDSLFQRLFDRKFALTLKIHVSFSEVIKEHQLFIPILRNNHCTLVELGLERSGYVLRYYDSLFNLSKGDMESSN